MSSTAMTATQLDITKSCLAGGRRMTCGLTVLATGTVEVDTGLSEVEFFVATGVSGTNTEGVVLTVMEDLPCLGSAVTVDGTKIDEGEAVANASTQQFCWFAIGT